VTEIPGTTRDAIEAPATCDGFPFRLIDTAGLRDTSDRIEQMGIEVSRRYLASADVVLFCVESGRSPEQNELGFIAGLRAPTILLRTKSDSDRERAPRGEMDLRWKAEIAVSAVSGAGLPEVRSVLAQMAFTTLVAGGGQVEALVTRERHRMALGRAAREIEGFRSVRDAGIEGAVAATHLRAAVTALEDVIGLVTSEDVLDRLFATFCVGK